MVVSGRGMDESCEDESRERGGFFFFFFFFGSQHSTALRPEAFILAKMPGHISGVERTWVSHRRVVDSHG